MMPDLAVNQSLAAHSDSSPLVADARTARFGHLNGWAAPGLSVATISLATMAVALFSADLVTGSQQEHFQLVGAVDWLLAVVATGFVLMVGRADPEGRTRDGASSFVPSVTTVWATMAAASIFGPPLVTGADPNQIPLVALLVPLAAMVATGFICLHATTRARRNAT